MVRSPLTHLTRSIPRKSLFKKTPYTHIPSSKRNLNVIRYAPAEYPKGRKKQHEVEWTLIPRTEHFIQWENLTTKYIDTHTHLHSTLQQMKDAFNDGTMPASRIDSFVEHFFPEQCTAVVDVLGNMEDLALYSAAAGLAWREGFKYYFAIGAHPYHALVYDDSTHHAVTKILEHQQCVALGECGLDYFRTDSITWPKQRQVFIRQLEAAVFARKPILVYTRDAERDTFSILHDYVPTDHKLHIQSFTGSREFALKILKHWPNSTLGITGAITYSGSQHVAEMIEREEIPLDRIMLGSKSPFIVPKNIYPHLLKTTRPKLKREKFVAGHSGMLPIVAEAVAGLLNNALKKGGDRANNDDYLHKMDSILKSSNEVAKSFFGIKM
ncbi:Metallo-dependent hydrolase [Choiromyces venosus 120613-1]|uniref:Metallo-dependent hydrolase n=1 Tax=Choiromyces venosus 120613-1 TaxID=1336337 RepID=A0A3N4JY27_9PEZI|nr:Metallo-dependent hydrolase [Choiromyces venosus 120613-1]